jgi:hypothetical protein
MSFWLELELQGHLSFFHFFHFLNVLLLLLATSVGFFVAKIIVDRARVDLCISFSSQITNVQELPTIHTGH